MYKILYLQIWLKIKLLQRGVTSTYNSNYFIFKNASQVAHAETPKPVYSFSDSSPNHLALAPVGVLHY